MLKFKKIYLLLTISMIIFSSCGNPYKKPLESTPWFDSILNKADSIQAKGDKIEGLNLVKSARTKDNLNIVDQLNYFDFCDNIYRNEFKDYKLCVADADSILIICNENKWLKNVASWQMQAYNNKGDALMLLGKYIDAFDCYYQAKKLAEEHSDSCGLSRYSYSLSMVLFKQQKYMEAAHYFIETYNEVSKCSEDFPVFYKKQELLDNLGLCYYHAKNYDSGIQYYNKALQFIADNSSTYISQKKIAIETAKAIVYGNLADIFRDSGKKDSAIALLKKSIAMNLQKGYANGDAEISQIKLAGLYFEKTDINNAEKVLKDIGAELDSMPFKAVELNWNKLMQKLYDYKKEPSKAYTYFLNYAAINDSLAKQRYMLMASDMEERISIQEKHHQLTLLQTEFQNQKIFLFIVSIVAILAVIIFIILKKSKRTRKNLEILTALNNTINQQKIKLEEANTDLEQQDKERTRILKSVAHDMMSPINAITSLSEMLISDSGNYPDEHKEMLNLIKKSSENSMNLSKDILEASVRTEGTALKKEWVNISDLLLTCIELLNFKAVLKRQKIIIKKPEENIYAFANKEKIWRVINNLLVNAIKFSYENSEIVVSLEEVKTGVNNVQISVKDSGVGIPEKNKPKLFDMFTEAKHIGTAGEPSHGLGLSISLQIARAHGGNIRFESEEGKGTTFYFEFPVNETGK